MRLGFVSLPERGRADALLAELAQALRAAGHPLVAMVRAGAGAAAEVGADPGAGPDPRPCEMHLWLWPADQRVTISQALGPGVAGCTLDPGALEQAVERTARALDQAVPGTAVILNKFGKQEAAGRGARALIAQALERDLPVLISVPPETRAAFDAFAGAGAQALSADLDGLAAFLGAGPLPTPRI